MTILRTVLSVLLLLTLFPAMSVKGENGKEPPSSSEQKQQLEREGQSQREIACSCCKACKAAKKDIQGKEEGTPPSNGCLECCRRCGSTESLDPRKLPPEVVPPEIVK